MTEQAQGGPPAAVKPPAYDSDKLGDLLIEREIELIAPHRANRRPDTKTQDGRSLRRYKRRWTVERTIPWIQNFRRLSSGFPSLQLCVALAPTGSGLAPS